MERITIPELLMRLSEDDQKPAKELIEKCNPNQLIFIECYLSEDKEFFGRGGRSYAEAYGYDFEESSLIRNICYANGSRLIGIDKIFRLANMLFTGTKLTDLRVDRRLEFHIFQHEHPAVSLGAIKVYNDMKGRLAPKNIKLDASEGLKKAMGKINSDAQTMVDKAIRLSESKKDK